MTAFFNPHMISIARESRGFSQADLADAIGISKGLMSKIENNNYPLTAQLMASIAKQATYPLEFFYQQGEPLPQHLAYRKRAIVSPKLLSQANATINILRLQLSELTTMLKPKSTALPNIEINPAITPAKAAIKLRRLWNIEQPVIENITCLLEENGVLIASLPFPSERIDSRTIFTTNNIPVICLNKVLQGDKQRFSLAFELGHLVMHTNTALDAARDINHEANLFAAELLMPEEHIMADFSNGINLATLAELKKKWKVSMIALLYRADDLGLITPNQKRYLIDQFNHLGLRRHEPPELNIPPEQPQRTKQLINRYLDKKQLSIPQLAKKLGMHTSEFRQIHNIQ